MFYSARVLILISLLGYSSYVCSQQLSHQVLVPLAGVTTTGALSYSHTIGETAIEIFESADCVFTQGFQQPCIKFTKEDPPPGTGVKVYPNPVSDYVNVELFGNISRTIKVEIINISGTIVYVETISFTDMYWFVRQIPTEKLSNGFYFVRIVSTDGILNKIFKIDKM
jgi:hypothetical protein